MDTSDTPSAPRSSHCSCGARPRQMRLVREDDGSWRSWDNSIDDCMDGRESIEVREVTDCDRKTIAVCARFLPIGERDTAYMTVDESSATNIGKRCWWREWHPVAKRWTSWKGGKLLAWSMDHVEGEAAAPFPVAIIENEEDLDVKVVHAEGISFASVPSA